MSSTLGTPELFAKRLGLNEYFGHSIQNFQVPDENYKVYVLKNINSKYTKRDINMPRYKKLIRSIEKIDPNIKLLRAFTNKSLREKYDKKGIAKKSSLVFRAKELRGHDYSGYNVNLLVGYPEPQFTHFNMVKKEYFILEYGTELGLDFYNHEAMAEVMQMMGRTLRDESDKSQIILADDRYTNINKINKLPSYFQRKIIIVDDEEELIDKLKDFEQEL